MSRVRSISLPSRRLVPLLFVIAVAGLLALGVAIDPSSRSTPEPDSGSSSSGSTDSITEQPLVQPTPGTTEQFEGELGNVTERDAKVAADDVAGGVAPSASEIGVGTASTLAAPPIDERIVRTASIELRIDKGGFEDAWGDASAVAGATGGSISTASRSGSGTGPRTGTITLRIPSARFDDAVAKLRDIPDSTVRRLDIASQDVTQEYVDVKSRLRHDRAVEGRLLALLAQTKGVGEVLAVQARLDTVQEQIEVSTGRLDYLTSMTSYSTVDITLRDPGTAKTKDDGQAAEQEQSVLGEAFGDARERFSENVASALVWFGGALPTLILLSIIAIVARVAWRRRTPTYRSDS